MLVELMLRLLELEFRFVPIALEDGEHLQEPFLKANPRGRVPVLELTDGEILVESVAICRYLAREQGRLDLFPADQENEYRVGSWVDHLRMSLCTPMGVVQWNRVWLQKFGKSGTSPDELAVQRAERQINRALGDLESHLLGRKTLLSPHLDAPSFADWISLPWLGYYRQADLQIDAYPRVQEWLLARTASPTWEKILETRTLLQQ